MGLWTKQQLREFIKENKLVTAQDAQNALKNLFAETIQEMLEVGRLNESVRQYTRL
uniref:hypothetical protein n=1 Tax=Paenibacillus alginolyticus TaxID=59839 RepID=UPI001FE54DC6|nr:hypothetical protein [Paenibacillus frigoriresistens]